MNSLAMSDVKFVVYIGDPLQVIRKNTCGGDNLRWQGEELEPPEVQQHFCILRNRWQPYKLLTSK